MMKRVFDILASRRNLALFIAAASATVLAFAYVSQYVFHYDPCPLCLWQRKPYFVAIALGLAAAGFSKNQRLSFYLLLGCGLAFLTGAGIAGFHNGVEQDWWKGLETCGDTQMPVNVSVEELREYLANRKVVDCRVPTWKFLGLSMTFYNLLVSTGLAVFTFFFTLRSRPQK